MDYLVCRKNYIEQRNVFMKKINYKRRRNVYKRYILTIYRYDCKFENQMILKVSLHKDIFDICESS